MDTDIELLNYIHENGVMGKDATTSLAEAIKDKDNKIKDVVADIIKSYEQFTKDSEKLLELNAKRIKKPSPIATVSADLSIKFKMLDDNSDAAIADMLIKGLTMGEIEMEKRISSLGESADEDIVNLAEDFKDFQSKAIVKLKKYL